MKSIPGPKTPSFLQSLQWVFDPVSYLKSTHNRYPDIFMTRNLGLGSPTSVLVSHPQALQQLFTSDRKQFSVPVEFNRILQPLIGEFSIFLIGGNLHAKRRQLVMPSFHGDRIRAYGELIYRITEQVMDQLPPGKSFLALDVMQAISLEVIIKAVFGISKGERYLLLKQNILSLTEPASSPLTSALIFFPNLLQNDWGSWSPWGRFLKRRQQTDDLIYAEIAERRANPDPNRTDILALLMRSRDEQGQALSDQELRDELMTLLLAGYETTATAITWGLYWMHRLPNVKEKLLNELNSLGDFTSPLEISRLPYLSAFCQETLRICPVAMITFPRISCEPVKILGYPIEPGTIIAGCIYLTHHREDLYPNSSEFRPERFLERQYSPYEFIAFGGGSRRCVGDALAQFEMMLILATIACRYQLALADLRPEKLHRRGLALAPSRGVKMVMQKKTKRDD